MFIRIFHPHPHAFEHGDWWEISMTQAYITLVNHTVQISRKIMIFTNTVNFHLNSLNFHEKL